MGLFYKRGCQVKTLSPSQGGFVFLGIQPLLATLTLLRIALWASPRISGSHLAFVRSALAPISSSVATWPTMVLSEARAVARHYGFVGLSEGAWWPVRLIRLSRPGYLPSNPCAQLLQPSNVRVTPPDWVVVRAYAACGIRCWAANVSPFFHRIRAIAAILRASVSRAMAGSIPLATLLS